MPSVQLRSFGGLNSDSHVQDIRNGDYTDAKNIEHISAEQGESLAITPRTGNKYSFDIGSISASNKVFRITFFLADINNLKIRVLHPNGVTPLKNNLNNLIITDALDFQNEIQTAFTNAGYSITVSLETQDTEKLVYILTADPTDQKLRYYDYIIQSIGDSQILVEVIQEAISTSREGSLEIIGSTDLLGDLFIISSTKRNEPIDYTIDTTVISPIGGLIVFNLTASNLDNSLPNYGFEQGQEIYVTGITGSNFLGQQASVANGLYIVYDFILDANTGIFSVFVLNQYPGLTIGNPIFGTGGMMKLNPFGFGQIGVAVKNESLDVWTYTSLLSSKEIGLWIKYRCDVRADISNKRKNIYFTDGYNPPFVFSYKKNAEYLPNGSIKSLHPNIGLYSYGSIFDSLRHFAVQPVFTIDFIDQDQSGGSLYSGNTQYFARGVYFDGTYSDWSLGSNLIPVYSSNNQENVYKIIGDIEGTQTNKANKIRISNISSNIFEFIEVAALNYVPLTSDTTTYGIFAKVRIPPGSNSIDIVHNGRETGVDLIAEELSVQTIVYSSAKNNEIIDNRYLLSNLKITNYDIANLFANAKYAVRKKRLAPYRPYPNARYGGHQDPKNVFYHTGYMINETYRIGARARFKDGSTSMVIHLFDVKIDTNGSSIDGKRIAGLSDYSLKEEVILPGAIEVYDLVPYVEITGIDIVSSTLNGVKASDLIDRIEIFRATVDSPSILGYGYSVLHVKTIRAQDQKVYTFSMNDFKDRIGPFWMGSGHGGTFPPYGQTVLNTTALCFAKYLDSPTTDVNPNGNGSTLVSFEYPFISGSTLSGPPALYIAGSLANNPNQVSDQYAIKNNMPYYSSIYTANTGLNANINTGFYWNDKYTSIYLVDDIISNTITTVTVNDTILNFGAPQVFTFIDFTRNPDNFYTEFKAVGLSNTFQQVGIDEIKYYLQDDSSYLNSSYITKKTGHLLRLSGINQTTGEAIEPYDVVRFREGYVIQTDSVISPLRTFSNTTFDYDRGLRLIQIKRNVSNQYSIDFVDKYVYTGSFITPTSSNKIDVFGGDAFNTNIYVKNSFRADEFPPNADGINGSMSQAICLNAQSRLNPYFVYKNEGDFLFPNDSPSSTGLDIINMLKFWFDNLAQDTYFYNAGYSPIKSAYDYKLGKSSLLTDTTENEYEARIIYSDLKPQGTTVDNFRRFGLLSYTDLDASFGEIVDMKNVNGELFTLQPNKYQRQFFNTRGTLQLSDMSQIVLGDASVLSRPGITLSSYGCSNKWTVILGKSQGGNDTIYWYDKIRKKFVRFGADGTVPLSDRSNTRTISSDGLKWLLDYDSATLDYGMHGTWNSRLGEAIWTLRAYREPDIKYVYDPDNVFNYKPGQIVYNPLEQNHINFEETIVLYVVTVEHSSSLNIVPGLTPGWENYYFRPSIDDPNYYSIRTISFSEYKNRFNQFQESYHPRIYLPWKDTFLSPRPKNPFSLVYEHNAGEILRWYDYNGDIQEEEGFIEVVFNIDPNITKRYVALICNSEISPYRLELQTRTQSTVINGPEFEQQLEQFFAPIPNVAINGQTTLDNDFMYGQWVKIRFYYQPGVFQRLTNIVLKFNPMVRLWNT
jgi:hypothetical protein